MIGYIASIKEDADRILAEIGRRPNFVILGEVQFAHLIDDIKLRHNHLGQIFADSDLPEEVSSLKVSGIVVVRSAKRSQYQYGF